MRQRFVSSTVSPKCKAKAKTPPHTRRQHVPVGHRPLPPFPNRPCRKGSLSEGMAWCPPPCLFPLCFRFYADLYSNEDIIAIVDDDCLLTTPATPEVCHRPKHLPSVLSERDISFVLFEVFEVVVQVVEVVVKVVVEVVFEVFQVVFEVVAPHV